MSSWDIINEISGKPSEFIIALLMNADDIFSSFYHRQKPNGELTREISRYVDKFVASR